MEAIKEFINNLVILSAGIIIAAVIGFTAGRIYTKEHIREEVVHKAMDTITCTETKSPFDEMAESIGIILDICFEK